MSKKATGLILVIVESPGKIEKIQHILGDNYKVMASVGHIIDLDKSAISIDFENNYKPIYKINDDKREVVKKLKNAYYDCADLLIATDEDREGEMIAWSIATQLNVITPKRITFNSITKKELLDAVKKPGKINDNLVDAQKLRRMLDRIIGYKLSPLLWKSMGGGKLSAGRVQSVIVKLIIEKENEITDFFSAGTSSFFKSSGDFTYAKNTLKAQLYTTKEQEEQEELEDDNKKNKNDEDSNESNDNEEQKSKKTLKSKAIKKESSDKKKGQIARIPGKKEAENVMKEITKSEFIVSDTLTKESIRQPSAPFTTSTLQQEASTKFGFTSKRTMTAAQHLYEAGHITYMRTDSVNLSEEAIKIIGEYVVSKYGKEYHRQMNYKSKSKNTQEAHEAIRPTDPKVLGVNVDPAHKISTDEIKLYTLIWKRAVASQMSPAKFDVTAVNIGISKLNDYYFVSHLENNTFLGYLVVYNIANDKNEVDENDDENNNTKVEIPNKGTKMNPKNVICAESYKNPPTRYGEATLIKKLETLGIGRPSTYSAFIDKIQNIEYVRKEDVPGEERDSVIIKWNGDSKSKIETENKKILLGKEKNKFVPTSVGILVVNFLQKHFVDIMDYKFTAEMEEKLDDIAEGKITLFKVIDKFWKQFKPLVEDLDKKIVPKAIMDEKARELGIHPNGNKIIATMARYGPVVKMIDKDNEKSVSYAPIKKPLTIEKIKLEDAIELFKFPKNLGRHNKQIVSLNRGKYGYWVSVGNNNVSVKIQDDNIESFTLEDAIKALEEKSAWELWKGTDSKNRYIVCDGEYGRYIRIQPLIAPKTAKKLKSVSLPKDTDLSTLTVDKVLEIIATVKAKNKKRKEDAVEKKKGKDTKQRSESDKSEKKEDKPKKTTKKINTKENNKNNVDEESPKKVTKKTTKKKIEKPDNNSQNDDEKPKKVIKRQKKE